MKKCKLGDILDVRRGTSLSGKFYSEEGEKIRLTLGNFNYPNGGFKENTSKSDIYFIGEVKPEFVLNKGDIITPLTEQVSGLLGETARIPEDNLYIQSGDIGLIIPNERFLNKEFAYYLVSSSLVKKQLDVSSQQTKIRHTSPEKIKDCEVPLPDMDDQIKIGILLDNINLKIENNNKINAELEAMAKTIYDYWFLQFEFPNEEGKPYKSSGGKMVWNEELKREIPEGWEVGYFKDVINELECGNRPKGGIIDSIDDGIPSIGAENIISIGKYDFSSEKYIPQEYFNSLKKGIVKSNDVLIYKDGAGVGNVSMAKNNFPHEKCAVNSHVFIVRSKDNNLYQNYIYLTLEKDYIKKILVNLAMKAAQPGLNQSNIESIPIIIPTKNIIKEFNKSIDIVFNRIFLNANESKELASLRDFLLPLLMNGQISFKQLALAED